MGTFAGRSKVGLRNTRDERVYAEPPRPSEALEPAVGLPKASGQASFSIVFGKESDISITIHPIRTGSVRVKTAQRRRKPGGLLRVLTDPEWTEWLPILAWVIDHPEGPILVDTGETSRTAHPSYFPRWHPYYRWGVRMRVRPEEEVGPGLARLGIDPREVKRVVLTHFHTDHAGGLHHFPEAEVFVSKTELGLARGLLGRMRGYLPHRWPSWFEPVPIVFPDTPFGAFDRSFPISVAGDVRAVPTPGHTPGHLSVVISDEGTDYFLAGDTSYTQRLLLAQRPDGVSPKPSQTLETLGRILAHGARTPTVYLPSHDPESEERFRKKATLPAATVMEGAPVG
jgi:glyoxylase-like metal-dependent hydrolase (beta-lactamase superfamily II)